MDMSQLKILYAPGPIDAASVYSYWLKGEVDPYHCTIPFVYQFYDLCQELNAKAYILSRGCKPGDVQDSNFKIRHSPVPFQTSRFAALYYLGQIWTGFELIIKAIIFNPDILVIQGGRTFPFFLSPIAWLGIKVIPSYHCVLWEKYRPKSKINQLIWNLNRRFFQRDCLAILSTSKDITDQVNELTVGGGQPVVEFLSIYQKGQFTKIQSPAFSGNTFNVLFVGRMSRNKGIFDLFDIAKRFQRNGQNIIRFDLCGTGPGLEVLKRQVSEAGLENVFLCHGHCNRPQLLDFYEKSHVVIVPTTTRFSEGLNQVILEGVLSGRPVITSSVCPAIHYVREAVVEVPPDDIQAYGDAILNLFKNKDLYDIKYKSCIELQNQFYDLSKGWGAKLKFILEENGLLNSGG
jgi:glycogen(starch) synthase